VALLGTAELLVSQSPFLISAVATRNALWMPSILNLQVVSRRDHQLYECTTAGATNKTTWKEGAPLEGPVSFVG
jgi:hypothetical protein